MLTAGTAAVAGIGPALAIAASPAAALARLAGLPPPTVPGQFLRLAAGLDVVPLNAELDAHPELWDAMPLRTTLPASPFAGTSDVWVRALAPELLARDRFLIAQPHEIVAWPAWHALPALRSIVARLLALTRASELGHILLTRIPPGGQVAPHADGGWLPERFDLKCHVALRSNPGCINRCEDDAVVFAEGECWSFDNLRRHSIENNGDTDRVVAIICMRSGR